MKFTQKIHNIYSVAADEDGDDMIELYNIVFMQREDDVSKMAEDLGIENAWDADDKEIIEYLKQWEDSNIEHHESHKYKADELNSKFLGYVIDDQGNRVGSAKTKTMKEGYVFSRNNGLNYYGLAYFKRLSEPKK